MDTDDRIHFECSNCHTKYVAKQEQIGKEGKCKKCGEVLVVPSQKPVRPPSENEGFIITIFPKMMGVLSVPIGLINLLGGIVSGIWLAFLGEWGAIGYGIGAIFISGFGLSLALMPSMIFALPSAYFAEKQNKLGTYFFAFLANIYDIAIISGWCVFVLYFFAKQANSNSFIPMLIWSYGVATGPITYMAQKELQSGESIATLIATFFAQFGYLIIILIVLFFPVTISDVLVVFILIMIVGLTIQLKLALEAMKFDAKFPI